MEKANTKSSFGFGVIAILFVLAVAGAAAVAGQQYFKAEKLTDVSTSEVVEESESANGTTTTTIDMEGETSTEILLESTTDSSNEEKEPAADSGQRAVVTLAGGCFWCTEAYMQETAGVVEAISGYTGGTADTATYKLVSKGSTNHKEAVQVTYDPARVSFAEILEVYWSHINPTDGGGQFADRGPQYKTAIFYHTQEQKVTAEASKSALASSGLFNEPIATEILPFTYFFEAEEYHQDYYKKASAHYERYKKGSGRAGFIDDNWAKEAALEFFAEQEEQSAKVETTSKTSSMYIERNWSESEIQSGLKLLSAEAYKVVAEEGTERAYQNAYYDNKEAGIYVDVVTGRPLFSSTHKYDSQTGWPSFYQPISNSNIIQKTDYKLVLPRIEVRSESGHLGHIFNDGPTEHGGKRYCINSLALKFIPKAEMSAKGYGDYSYLFE